MSTVTGRDLALIVYSEESEYLASSIDTEIEGKQFYENIVDFEFGNSEVDLADFQTGTVQISVEIYLNFQFENYSGIDGAIVKLFEIIDSSQFGLDNINFIMTKTERSLSVTKDYFGIVEESEILDGNRIKLDIRYNHNYNFEDKLQEFNKNTYGQYTIFKGEIDSVKDFIVMPDASSSSIIPIGRYWSDRQPLDVTPGTNDSYVNFSTFSMDAAYVGTTPGGNQPFHFSVWFEDFIALANNEVLSGDPCGPLLQRESRVPPGQLVSTLRYEDSFIVPIEGWESTYVVDPTDSAVMTSLGLTALNQGTRSRFKKYGTIVFYRVPAGGSEITHPVLNGGLPTGDDVVLVDFENTIRAMIGEGKLAGYAFKYDYFKIRVQDNSALPGSPAPDGSPVSSVTFHCYEAIDLIAESQVSVRGRVALDCFDIATSGTVLFTDGSGAGLRMGQYDESGNVSADRKLFDPEFLSSATGNKDIEPLKWIMAVVPSMRVVHKIRTEPTTFQGISSSLLTNLRVDSIDLDSGFEFLVNYQNQTDTSRNQKYVEHESIFQIATGQFAYINQTFKAIVHPQAEIVGGGGSPLPSASRPYTVIEFKLPNQSYPELEMTSVPNTLYTTTTDDFNFQAFMISFRNPPENSPHEGSIIPWAYGYIEKMPILQVISKKHNYIQLGFSGDDIYTVCAHPIARSDHNSVQVWWGLDEIAKGGNALQDPGTNFASRENFYDSAKPFVLPNPFPSRELVVNRYGPTGTSQYSPANELAYAIQLKNIRTYLGESNPLHYVVELEDNLNQVHTAIRLRGDEYDVGSGIDDPRFFIRNGLGSSKLFVSFVGHPDDQFGTYTGVPNAPITHPAHIIKHLLYNFSIMKDEYVMVNEKSIIDAYTETPELFLGVWILDKINIWDLISLISEHCFIYLVYEENEYKMKHLDFNSLNKPKHFFSYDTDMDDVDSEKFFEGITDYTFSYKYYFAADKYIKKVRINKENNTKCRGAFKRTFTNKSKVVELPFCFLSSTVNKIIPKYIDLFSVPRTQIEFDSPIDGRTSRLELFDVVSVNHPKVYDHLNQVMGMTGQLFRIIGRKKERNVIKFKLLQMNNPIAKANNQIGNSVQL